MASSIPSPTDDELAERWFFNHGSNAYGLGEFRRYNVDRGIWEIVSEPRVKNEILDEMMLAKPEGIRPTDSRLKSVVNIAKVMSAVEDGKWDANPDILVCKNGILQIPKRALTCFSPVAFATTAVPYDYNPNATAPHWMQLLSRLEPGDRLLLQEFAGYCLTAETKYEKALWLYGPPGGGKSTFEEGIQAMAGEKCCHIGLSGIVDDRFGLKDLPGKTIAISREQPSSIRETAVLNSLISGEPVKVERKFCDAVIFNPKAKLILAMNTLPRILSANNGLYRRLLLVEFPAIQSQDINPGFKELIKAEAAGILNWALDGLCRLVSQGHFTIPESVLRRSEDYRASNDPQDMFLAERCVKGSGYRIQASVLNGHFRIWCSENGYQPMSDTRLAGEWKRLGFDKYPSNGRYYYRGIDLSAA